VYASCRVVLVNCLVVVGVILVVHQCFHTAVPSSHSRIGLISSVTNKRMTDQRTHIPQSFTVEELQGLIQVGDTFVRDPRSLTIVCQLSGELGNNIGKFVHSLVLWMKLTRQQQLQQLPKRPNANSSDVPTFTFHIALRHAPYSNWVQGHRDAKQCFSSSLGRLNFSEAYNSHYDKRAVEQNDLHWTQLFAGINVAPHAVQEALDNFIRIATDVRHQTREDEKETTVTSMVTNNSGTAEKADSPISLPFLGADTLVGFPSFAEFVDEYYYEIRQFLQFDMEACCALLPEPDESVFVSKNTSVLLTGAVRCLPPHLREHLLNHYLTLSLSLSSSSLSSSTTDYFRQHHRSFVREMPRVGFALGFEEMGPQSNCP
jgi:hypothetical protein